jgi:hypothetical protein
MHLSQLKDKALKTFNSLTLYIPAVMCFLLAGLVVVRPESAVLALVLFMVMVGGIFFSVARKVNTFRSELNSTIDKITATVPSSLNTSIPLPLQYKQLRKTGANAQQDVLITTPLEKHQSNTVITEAVTTHLSLSPEELEELKKKVTIH